MTDFPTLVPIVLAVYALLLLSANFTAQVAQPKHSLRWPFVQAALILGLWAFLLGQWPWLGGRFGPREAHLLPLLPLAAILLYFRSEERDPDKVGYELGWSIVALGFLILLISPWMEELSDSRLAYTLVILFAIGLATGAACEALMMHDYSIFRAALVIPGMAIALLIALGIFFGTIALVRSMIPASAVTAYRNFTDWLAPAGIVFSVTMCVLVFIVYPIYRLVKWLR